MRQNLAIEVAAELGRFSGALAEAGYAADHFIRSMQSRFF